MINAKNISFLAMVLQQTVTVLLVRYSKTKSTSIPYLSSVVVFSSELYKFILNSVLEIVTTKYLKKSSETSDETIDLNNNKDLSSSETNVEKANQDGDKNIVSILKDLFDVLNKESLKMVVPATLYAVQNNLFFFALANLSVPTYQMTNQGKLLTTAIISRIMLKREISTTQYVAIFLLGVGVAVVNISEYQSNLDTSTTNNGEEDEEQKQEQNQFLGMLAMAISCMTSGFCGVYFELVIKTTQQSVLCRNVHLALYSLILATFTILYTDFDKVRQDGFFQGFNFLVLTIVTLQGMIGFISSMMFKYSTAVLKGFASSIAVVLAIVASSFIFDTSLDLMFVVGAGTVGLAIKLYSAKHVSFHPNGMNGICQNRKDVRAMVVLGLFCAVYVAFNFGVEKPYLDDLMVTMKEESKNVPSHLRAL